MIMAFGRASVVVVLFASVLPRLDASSGALGHLKDGSDKAAQGGSADEIAHRQLALEMAANFQTAKQRLDFLKGLSSTSPRPAQAGGHNAASAAVVPDSSRTPGKTADGLIPLKAGANLRKAKQMLDSLGSRMAGSADAASLHDELAATVGLATKSAANLEQAQDMLAQLVHVRPSEAEKAKKHAKKVAVRVAGAVVGGAIGAGASIVTKVLDRQTKARGAWCGFHSAKAAQYLTRAGIQMAMAVKGCLPESGMDMKNVSSSTEFLRLVKSPCTADVENIVGSLVWVASYVSLLASECAAHANLDALCAGTIEAVIAGLAQTAAAGQLVVNSCIMPHVPPEFDAVTPTRRLGPVGPAFPESSPAAFGASGPNLAFSEGLARYDAKEDLDKEDLDLEMSLCVLDATQVATDLGTFGLGFDQTILACAADQVAGGVPKVGVAAQEYCVVEVSYVLFNLFSASSFLSSALNHCAKAIGIRMGSSCASAIMRILAGISGVPALGAGMDAACPGTENSVRKVLGPLAKPVVKISALGRRLSNSTTSQPEALLQGLKMLGLGGATDAASATGSEPSSVREEDRMPPATTAEPSLLV
mmetsp:Transcript_134125/g.428561  ORF Transcript_134125/g.428561 Transcript_134125/m.428561 type:complete len:590 (-) Transcript_134125:54-1823(-)